MKSVQHFLVAFGCMCVHHFVQYVRWKRSSKMPEFPHSVLILATYFIVVLRRKLQSFHWHHWLSFGKKNCGIFPSEFETAVKFLVTFCHLQPPAIGTNRWVNRTPAGDWFLRRWWATSLRATHHDPWSSRSYFWFLEKRKRLKKNQGPANVAWTVGINKESWSSKVCVLKKLLFCWFMFNILNLDWMVITIWTKHKKVPTFQSRVSFCFKVGQLAIPRILFEKNDSDVLRQIFFQGYVLMNDWSARDIQARKKKRKRRNTKHHKITRWLWFSNFGLQRSTYLGKPNLKSTYQGPQASTVYPKDPQRSPAPAVQGLGICSFGAFWCQELWYYDLSLGRGFDADSIQIGRCHRRMCQTPPSTKWLTVFEIWLFWLWYLDRSS